MKPPRREGPLVVVAGVALTPDEVAALPPRLAALVRRRLDDEASPDTGVSDKVRL